jgi:hypothetical protein
VLEQKFPGGSAGRGPESCCFILAFFDPANPVNPVKEVFFFWAVLDCDP